MLGAHSSARGGFCQARNTFSAEPHSRLTFSVRRKSSEWLSAKWGTLSPNRQPSRVSCVLCSRGDSGFMWLLCAQSPEALSSSLSEPLSPEEPEQSRLAGTQP